MATILITSGGTKVRIDEVRHVGNMSSGRFGADIARAALKSGNNVIFLCAKGSMRPDEVTLNLGHGKNITQVLQELLGDDDLMWGCRNLLTVDTFADFDEYATKLQEHLVRAKPDVTILAAAVSDYGMPPVGGKISSDEESITFTMTKLPKLITKVKTWCPKTFLVGFKLLVGSTPDQMHDAAMKQIHGAKSDLVVANDLHDIKQGKHTLHIFSPTNVAVFNEHLAEGLIGYIRRVRLCK